MANQLIETIEVGAGGAASISFSNIPQDGITLKLVIQGRSTIAGNQGQVRLRLNGDSGAANYDQTLFRLTTSNRYSQNLSNADHLALGNLPGSTSTTGLFGEAELTLLNYTSSEYKNGLATAQYQNNTQYVTYDWLTYGYSYRRNVTEAITAIQVYEGYGASFAEGTIASLYKIY